MPADSFGFPESPDSYYISPSLLGTHPLALSPDHCHLAANLTPKHKLPGYVYADQRETRDDCSTPHHWRGPLLCVAAQILVSAQASLQAFTHQIFLVNTSSRDEQRTHASVTLDRGVQCEPLFSPPASVEVGVQCDLPEQPTAALARIEDNILEAENQSLKLQLKTFECADYEGNNRWTEVKKRKPKYPVSGTVTPAKSLYSETDRPSHRGERRLCTRFLDIVRPSRTSSEPRPCCEVLIAGTNDLAVGEQRYITAFWRVTSLLDLLAAPRSSSPHCRTATIWTRPTVLVNAYIEELASRHNLIVLNFDDISRRYFTGRGKRLLVGKIVSAMKPYTQGPEMTARFRRKHRETAASTASIRTPATTPRRVGDHPSTAS
ncbi:hypothetical protein J6590_023565 [Homalodisca vitripennis]|nr:hypothetical protein J6590_023565 [Homalodisca vitripennis]